MKKKKLLSIDEMLINTVKKHANNINISANEFIIQAIKLFIEEEFNGEYYEFSERSNTSKYNNGLKCLHKSLDTHTSMLPDGAVYLTDGFYLMPDGSLKTEEELF
jgi:hypothetical protein